MNRLAVALGVFLVTLTVLSLFAWERLKAPSPHFHFTDLAYSLLHGRLDTDTPRRTREEAKDDLFGPPGYYEAVVRATSNPDGSWSGWNDWASVRVLQMRTGEELRGVFPWRDTKERKNEFHALDGNVYSIDCARDVATGCYGGSDRDVKHYVSFPPFPAIVMMPLVAIWDFKVNDVWFTLFFGALNGLLLFLLLQYLTTRGHSARSRSDNLWITALFVFGTVHFFSAVRGEVWFTALIVGVALNLVAIAFTIELRRPFLAGVFLICAAATRTPLQFACILMALLALFPEGRLRKDGWGRTLGKLALYGAPIALGLAALLWYNHARFDSPLEYGHTYLQEGARDSIRRHGLESGWFLGPNLSAAFVNPPIVTTEEPPYLKIPLDGLGLLWTSPVLLLLLWTPNRTWLFKSLVITAFVVALPGLFYQNTGRLQFGYRFGLDWLPFLVVAFAVGGRPLTWRVKALIVAGIVVNAFGALTFGRANGFYW